MTARFPRNDANKTPPVSVKADDTSGKPKFRKITKTDDYEEYSIGELNESEAEPEDYFD